MAASNKIRSLVQVQSERFFAEAHRYSIITGRELFFITANVMHNLRDIYIVTRRRIEFCRYDIPTTVAAGPVTGEGKTSLRGNEHPQRCVCPEPSSRKGDAGNT